MTRLISKRLLLFLLVCVMPYLGISQNIHIQDSINIRLNYITTLKKSGDLEKAQLEAEDLRWFLRRENVPISSRALNVFLEVYTSNKDEISKVRILTDSELGLKNIHSPKERFDLSTHLAHQFELRGDLTKALYYQKLSVALADSVSIGKNNSKIEGLKSQMDSISTARKLEMSQKDEVITMPKDRAYLFFGLGLLAFLGLITAHFAAKSAYNKRLEAAKLDLELSKIDQERLIANSDAVRNTNIVATTSSELVNISQHTIPSKSKTFLRDEEVVKQLALIVEPNRQIALYLKSLLNDQYEIEATENGLEAIRIANEEIPDLIICDAELKGLTGIDVSRQLTQGERTGHIPLILLTTKHGEEGRLDAIRAGAHTWFPRPVIDDEMDIQLNSLLKIKKAMQSHFARVQQLWFTPSKIEPSSPFLQEVLAIIEANISNPDFSSEILSNRLQLTRTQCQRKVLALTGKTPTQLIKEMRLEKAKSLLELKAAPPAVIAELVGFTNQGTFSRAYKEYFGDNTKLLG